MDAGSLLTGFAYGEPILSEMDFNRSAFFCTSAYKKMESFLRWGRNSIGGALAHAQIETFLKAAKNLLVFTERHRSILPIPPVTQFALLWNGHLKSALPSLAYTSPDPAAALNAVHSDW